MNKLPIPPTKTPIIPKGFCQCGCGQKTSLAPVTRKDRNWIKGQPESRLAGHHDKSPVECLLDTKTGCWNWQKGKGKAGYGLVHVGRHKMELAHRIYYKRAYGDIPKGMNVLHKCDNPACCNPDHLFLGTHSDNTQDMISKKRNYVGGAHNPAKGSRHGVAKLTEEIVIAIRQEHNGKWGENTRIGKKYGVSPSVISDIVLRRRWKHI